MNDKDKKSRGKLEGLFSGLPGVTHPEPVSGAPPAGAARTYGALPTGDMSAVLRAVLDSTDEGILGLDRQGKHTFVNSAAAEMLGYPVEELVRQHSHTLWHHTRADGSSYPAEECPIHDTCATGASHRVDNEVFWRKDNTPFPVEYTTTPTREGGRLTGVVVTFRNLTERKRVENTLHQNQVGLQENSEQLRTLLEYVPGATVIVDTDTGKFADSNENAVRLYGLSRQELLKVGPADMSPPTQPDGRPSSKASVEMMQQALKGGTLVVEWMHRNAAGQDILCEVRLVRMPATDRNLVCASIADITSRRQTELERERLLQDTRSRAQRDQLINAMVARVRASLTVEQALAATVEEIGATLGAARVAVRLDPAGGNRRGNEAR
jgi:PAS domain S-box-containing protein